MLARGRGASPDDFEPEVIGRYAMYDEIASGGMATVHLGRLLGPVGFSRTVAIKRLHPNYAKDPEFSTMFIDEARLAARIRHPNVVPTLDIVATDGELFIVMDYVHGASLAELVRIVAKKWGQIPLPILGHLISGMLQGLHAAHDARSDQGELLGIVHRDVSPQNLLVGLDGMPRLVDFGVAKAMGRLSQTQDGKLKGKIGYMSPEQVMGEPVTRASDIYGAGVVLWHALTGRKPVKGESEMAQLLEMLKAAPEPPSKFVPGLPKKLDDVVLRAMSRNPALRYPTAADMAADFEQSTRMATQREVAQWMEETVGPLLAQRSSRLTTIESSSVSLKLPDGFERSAAAVLAARGDAPRTSKHGQKPPAGQSRAELTPAATASSVTDAQAAGSAPIRRRWLVGVAALALGFAGTGAWLFLHREGASPAGSASAGLADGAASPASAEPPPTAASATAVASQAAPSSQPSTDPGPSASAQLAPGKPPTGTTRPPTTATKTSSGGLYVRE